MKKIVLSALAVLTLSGVGANAGDIKLYQDANGQVWTSAGEGRTEIKTKSTSVFAKSSKLKFSGQTFIGYAYTDYESGKYDNNTINRPADKSEFQVRRAYFQLKAYLLDDPKSYYRVTLDTHNDGGSWDMRMKYAYVYLNNILPSTGVELGLVHRPWHDYEEHNAWYFRNIEKVFTEIGNGAHLSNSADLGFNLKTKTKYFDSEIGVFNGEGYHEAQNSDGVSVEWRATGHILGENGKDKQTKKTYWDVSFFGQYNMKHKTVFYDGDNHYEDLVFGGLHTVFNTPSFLVAAQYIQSLDTRDGAGVSSQAGLGYSINGEFRFGSEKEFRVLGRYDSWTAEKESGIKELEKITYLGGVAWEQSKNIQWVANVTATDNEAGGDNDKNNAIAYMLSAEVKF